MHDISSVRTLGKGGTAAKLAKRRAPFALGLPREKKPHSVSTVVRNETGISLFLSPKWEGA